MPAASHPIPSQDRNHAPRRIASTTTPFSQGFRFLFRPITNANPARAWAQRGTKVNTTSHIIMVTTRYSNKRVSTSQQNLCQVQPRSTREHRELIDVKTMRLLIQTINSTVVIVSIHVLSGVLPVFQNLNCLNYKLQRELSDLCAAHPPKTTYWWDTG